MLHRYLQCRAIAGNSSVCCLTPALDLSFMMSKLKNYSTDEYSTMDTDGLSVPPLACAFAKMPQHQHIIGVVDEDGYLVLYNTHMTGQAAVIKTWQVHTNAVFDVEWLESENKLLTGSGDQTIALYDVETSQKLETFKGHGSSIKSISCRSGDDAVFVSGSRDGHIMKWDRRIFHKDGAIHPTNTIYNAHLLQTPAITTAKARKKRSSANIRDAQQSVTAVLFQNDTYLISAGAVDGCLKVWDIRKTYNNKGTTAHPVHVFQYAGTNSRRHGYSSLVLNSSGLRLFANCTDDVIYEYDVAAYKPEPIQTWRGHRNSTFYVKSSISSDDQFLVSGSSDELAYIWQINKPSTSPIVLKGHTAEVTSVAWCPNDLTKVVTLSDDTKIKFWRIYCRELQKQSLPPWCGRARKVSRERATITGQESVASSLVVSASAPASPHLTTPHRAQLHRTSSSPGLSPQGCLRSWLKRKSQANETDSSTGPSLCKSQRTQSQPQMPSSKSVAEEKSRSLSEKSGNKLEEKNCVVKDSGSCTDTNSIKKPCLDRRNEISSSEEISRSEESSSCITSPESSSRSTKRSHEESEESSYSGSPLFKSHPCQACLQEEESQVVADRKLKTSQCDILASDKDWARNDSELGESPRAVPPSVGCDDTNMNSNLSSPSKVKRHIGNVENAPYMSPIKIGKRKMSCDVISPAKSPKRPCLKVIESNEGLEARTSTVRVSLFPDSNVQNTSINGAESALGVKTASCTLNDCDSHELTPCKKALNDSESQVSQAKDDADFRSPTRNLPNLVMDQMLGHNMVTPPQARRSSLKCDWLTQMRLDKLKNTPEGISKQTGTGKSPKNRKSLKKISSYFKTKDV